MFIVCQIFGPCLITRRQIICATSSSKSALAHGPCVHWMRKEQRSQFLSLVQYYYCVLVVQFRLTSPIWPSTSGPLVYE